MMVMVLGSLIYIFASENVHMVVMMRDMDVMVVVMRSREARLDFQAEGGFVRVRGEDVVVVAVVLVMMMMVVVVTVMPVVPPNGFHTLDF